MICYRLKDDNNALNVKPVSNFFAQSDSPHDTLSRVVTVNHAGQNPPMCFDKVIDKIIQDKQTKI